MGVYDEILMPKLFCPRCGNRFVGMSQTKQLRNVFDKLTLKQAKDVMEALKIRSIDMIDECPKCHMMFEFELYKEHIGVLW